MHLAHTSSDAKRVFFCVHGKPHSLIGTSGSDAAEARANLAQQNGSVEACRGAGLVIFNLFGLEGFHVSEAYNVS